MVGSVQSTAWQAVMLGTIEHEFSTDKALSLLLRLVPAPMRLCKGAEADL